MSLDFYLEDADGNELFAANITHNLTRMASEAGIYNTLWRPDENGIEEAWQCIEPLTDGLLKLIKGRSYFEQFNSPNGWGLYEHFVPFVVEVLTACCDHPSATVQASR